MPMSWIWQPWPYRLLLFVSLSIYTIDLHQSLDRFISVENIDPHSERSKVPGMNVLPSTEVAVGDLVYIHADRNKSKARHRYLVVSVERARCNIRKLFGSQLRNTSYRVKRYECYKMPNDYSDMTPYPRRSFDAVFE